MLKILLVAPYAHLADLARQLGRVQPHRDVVLDVVEAIGVKCVDELDLDADVVISRGATASALRQRLSPHVPVVELYVTGYDVIRSVHRCKQSYRPARIVAVGSPRMINGVNCAAEALGIPIHSVSVSCEEDALAYLSSSIDKERDVVIGGSMSVRIAREFGLRAELIESGQESLEQAFGEAVHVARVAARERESAGRVRTIVNAVDQGIIAFDETGVVTLCNTAAMRLLGREDTPAGSLAGEALSRLLPGLDPAQATAGGLPERGIVVTCGERQLAVTLLPVRVENGAAGGIATFQEAAHLQEIEGRVRSALHRKGLKAKYSFADCLGRSAPLLEAVEQARRFARTEANLLIHGETGTGKEVFAQSMHNASPRREGPFVAVNCAALPENLLESEFFGYVGGAFTGAAKAGKAGLFELAHRGTIFLDEVSEIPLSLQGRLLRVLQEHEVMRLGDDRIIPVDVRVIAATNKDLKRLAAAGQFRQDLLYRLDVLGLSLPPLRERHEDIPLLARFFLGRHGESAKQLNPEAEQALLRHDWPGNIRELRNICERLAVLAPSSRITRGEAEQALGVRPAGSARETANMVAGVPRLRDMQYELLIQALGQTGGNKRQAALLLGISRATLWRKMRTYDIAGDVMEA